MKKKIPWGFFAAICGVFVFYLTAAAVTVFVILDRIEAETSGHASLFGTWYQILLFVFDLVFIAATVFFSVMSVRRRRCPGAAQTAELTGEKGEAK